MGATSYKVTVWAMQTRYKSSAGGKKVPARYVVRWKVEKERFDLTFKRYTQADSFRSDLMSASKRGEAFDRADGLPISMARPDDSIEMSWFTLACKYVDMKWDDSSPKHRSSIADSLIAITLGMAPSSPSRPDTSVASRALRWVFNKKNRECEPPERFADALRWFERSCRPVRDLVDPDKFRGVYSALAKKRDGSPAARDTTRLRRTAFRSALDYAIDLKVIEKNPFDEVAVRKQKVVTAPVDKRSVANPVQFRTVLMAVRLIAPRLVLFFALLYFAGLRPEEAVEVRREDFDIPKPTLNESTGEWEYGDGEIHLRAATPDVAGEWTDSGERGEKRDQLKHRERGQGRVSPCPAELSRIVYEHVAAYGLAPDGRLVRGQRDDRRLSSSVYQRVWQRAREATFVPEVVESPLAKRPYDLRHAFVSSALNATGDPVRVAEWAGHSVAVLLRVYAKCIAGGERSARTKLAAWLTGQ